ncbi:hypothetical protein [uncultured Sphingorhabdus sp.]|uniref:hypothetical protein n=1 Tax=uncultured Sphingorhabdus sp. TaxID=1686106 RepID=UPI0026095C36|nr:hypothetical protein [uncultured Sphingorhabdus sp.]
MTVSAGGRKAVIGGERLRTAVIEQSRLWTAVRGGAGRDFILDESVEIASAAGKAAQLDAKAGQSWPKCSPPLPVFDGINLSPSQSE